MELCLSNTSNTSYTHMYMQLIVPSKLDLFIFERNCRLQLQYAVGHFVVRYFVTTVLGSYFISLTVTKPLWDLAAKYCWNRPLTSLARSTPAIKVVWLSYSLSSGTLFTLTVSHQGISY